MRRRCGVSGQRTASYWAIAPRLAHKRRANVEQPEQWRVWCNGARWMSTFPSLADALAAIGLLSERSDLKLDHDWKIEIKRDK